MEIHSPPAHVCRVASEEFGMRIFVGSTDDDVETSNVTVLFLLLSQ